jgi:xylulokinase
VTEVTVGIDIGTTSVKAVAADGDGRVVARSRVPHELRIPAPDLMEHDAARAWRLGPRRALAQLGGRDGLRGVRGVCVAAMIPAITGVDRRGIPRTPGLLYGDGRGAAAGGASPAGSGEAVEFVRWTATAMPEARGYWPAPTVANYSLSGEPALDSATAFTLHPLYAAGGWDADRLAEVGARVDQMPRVAEMADPVGKIHGTGAADGAVLAAGTIDALADQVVSGAFEVGDVLVILGTTLIVWIVTPGPVECPGLWSLPHTTPGRFLVGGASNAGGLFLNWAARLIGRPSGVLDPQRVPVWLPYVRGERTPFHDRTLRASLLGLDLTHDASAVARASSEAAGFVVRHHIELSGTAPRRIVASGGGTRVREWVQALADCTGLPVDVVAVPEGGALGAAFVARVAAGLEASMGEAARWSRVGERVEPDPVWEQAAAGRYRMFREAQEDGRRRAWPEGRGQAGRGGDTKETI